MEIKRISLGAYAANCYVLIDENTKEAAVIDPGANGEVLVKEIDNLGVSVKYILLTHGHMDHIGAVEVVKEKYDVPVYINSMDKKMILSGENVFGGMWKEDNKDGVIKEGDILNLGNLEIKCIDTPGHTPGGMCFLIENVVFTGDTLFQGSIGRTDFAGGDFDSLIKNIKNKLILLPEDTVVLPGHGPESSIKYEKHNNPFL